MSGLPPRSLSLEVMQDELYYGPRPTLSDYIHRECLSNAIRRNWRALGLQYAEPQA